MKSIPPDWQTSGQTVFSHLLLCYKEQIVDMHGSNRVFNIYVNMSTFSY